MTGPAERAEEPGEGDGDDGDDVPEVPAAARDKYSEVVADLPLPVRQISQGG